MSKSVSSSTVVNVFPISTVLTVLFVLLKVFGKIAWSWWWVFAPLWLPTVAVVGFLIVAGIVALIALLIAAELK